MENSVNRLLCALNDEIDRKCSEIRHKREIEIWQRLFVIACALFVIVPVLLVFVGINLQAFLIPAILFIGISFVALSPLLLSDRMEGMER